MFCWNSLLLRSDSESETGCAVEEYMVAVVFFNYIRYVSITLDSILCGTFRHGNGKCSMVLVICFSEILQK